MIFLNFASSADLHCVCTHTDIEGKKRKATLRNILKSSEKTQYLINTLYILETYVRQGDADPVAGVTDIGCANVTEYSKA